MRSTENMAIYRVAPEARKVAARKHSLRESRKQSVVRERPLVTSLTVDEGVEENNFSDNDDDKPVTLRSCRLGTLEFLELEKFHERMKCEIRKESRLKKISRVFHQYQRNKQHSPGRKEDPLTCVLGEVSQKSMGKSSLTVGETSKNSSRKNSLAVSSSKKNSVVGISSAPVTRRRSRALTPDSSETHDPQQLSENNHCQKDNSEVLAKNSKDEILVHKNDPPLRPPFNLLQTPSGYETRDASNRKLTLDSFIKKIKETYPNECVLSVSKAPSQPIFPKKRRRKKPIQLTPLVETGRKLSQNITECIRQNNIHETVNKLGRKFSHEVTIENPHTPSLHRYHFLQVLLPKYIQRKHIREKYELHK